MKSDREATSVMDVESSSLNREEQGKSSPAPSDSKRQGGTKQAAASGGAGGVGLRFYKPGQGYHVRLWTAVGAGILTIWGAYFIQGELAGVLDPSASYALPVQYGVSVGFIALMAVVIYWSVGIGHKSNDFFIATEGEMKKVSWSSRQEIIRSTKVVIVATLLLGAFLFIADILFMEVFSWMNVLKLPSTLERLFESES